MRRLWPLALSLSLCSVAGSCWAQADQCAVSAGPGPASELMQRLRCTIQVLDAERMLLTDQLTDSKVKEQLAQAEVRRLRAELARLRPKPAEKR